MRKCDATMSAAQVLSPRVPNRGRSPSGKTPRLWKHAAPSRQRRLLAGRHHQAGPQRVTSAPPQLQVRQLESAPANSCFPCCLQVGVQTLPRHAEGPGRLRHRRRKPCKCVSGTGSPVRWCDVTLIVSSRFPAPTCMKSSMLWWRRRQGRSSRSSWRNLTRRTSVLTLSTLL